MLAFVVRASGFALVLVALGCAAFPYIIARAGIAQERAAALRDASARLGAACLTLFGAVIVARLYLQLDGMRFPGDPLAQSLHPLLTATLWGYAWIAQSIAAAAAVIAFHMSRRAHGAMHVAAAMLVVIAATFSLSGHAAAAESYRNAVIIADAAHVLAAGVWLGTLAIIALAARGNHDARELAAIVHAFSPVALTCAGVLALTGAAASLSNLGSLAILPTSRYGQILLVKLAAVAAVLWCGWFNWKRTTPRLGAGDTGALRRGIARELGAAVAVVLVTAALVVTPPE